jgi:hypothetical protein
MRRSSFLVSLLAALCIASCTNSKDPNVNSTDNAAAETTVETITMIDQIRPLMNAQVLSPGDRSEDADKLEQWLSQYLKNEYRVVAKRLFAVDAKSLHWMSIEKFVANEVEQPMEACPEEQSWHSPGFDLVAVWRVPNKPYRRIAVATLRSEDRESDRVVGYFDLDRIESSRNAENLHDETAACSSTDRRPAG